MGDFLLAPHNDDEALFAAYACMRYRPTVVVVLASVVEAGWHPPVHAATREAESAAACAVLGCTFVQWEYPDADPPWQDVRTRIEGLAADRLWAPLPEIDGHAHHNAIGAIASLAHPAPFFYSTYTGAGKSTVGQRVKPTEEEQALKERALACYPSQARHPSINGFRWPRDEYVSVRGTWRTPPAA